nr:FAD-binding oxidoreductase [Candidatus Njordarchaeota archaeon]
MLDREAYDALQQVVGADNITEEPAILDTYAYQWCTEVEKAATGEEPSRFGYRPEAVVLPSCTEEVQAIVKICNNFSIRFKAHSTGFGVWGAVSGPGAIQLDLRRMNKIIEIDEKNMYAVIEPYVTNAQLHSELLKKGLYHHMQGAGPQTSPFASHTSMIGPGFTSASTGFSGRNVLAVEWVLPTGEILKLGSLNSCAEWFSGDGPGPSLRGIMRGFAGAFGGLGVFTKCAIKLYLWPGPREWRVSGIIPNYEFEVPPYWKIYVINFKDWESFEKAYYKIGEAEVSMMAMTSSTEGLATMFSNTREDTIKKIFSDLMSKAQRYVVVLVAAHTEREFKYRTKLVSEITKEHGGSDLVEIGVVKPLSTSYAEAVRNMFGSHAFRFTSCFQSTHGGMDTISMAVNLAKVNKDIKLKYIKKELIGDDRGEGIWASFYEQGHFAHMEMPTIYDPSSAESCKGYSDYWVECNDTDIKKSLGIPFFIVGDKNHDLFGPHCNNYQVWLRKIKEAFDPNDISDSGHYISSKKYL